MTQPTARPMRGETEKSREERLEDLLSEGLDLCVRARQMDAIDRRRDTLAASSDPKAWQEGGRFDEHVKAHNEHFPHQPIATGSATPALWAQEQYDLDLADWEKRARDFLLYGARAQSEKR